MARNKAYRHQDVEATPEVNTGSEAMEQQEGLVAQIEIPSYDDAECREAVSAEAPQSAGEDIATAHLKQALELVAGLPAASQDPQRDEKLKAGWIMVFPNKPLFPPESRAFLVKTLKNIDPRLTPEGLDMSLLEKLRAPDDAPAKPEQPVAIQGTPFKTREAFLSYAPFKSEDADNMFCMKGRMFTHMESRGRSARHTWSQTVSLDAENGDLNAKLFVKLGVFYDNALFRKPYILKMNPNLVYGANRNFGFEIAEQRIFDVDREAAVIVRRTGEFLDAKTGSPILFNADSSSYLVEIQFLQSVI